MPPAARISDMHTCPMVNPGPVPHVGGPVSAGSPDVIIGFMPAGRVGDSLVCVPAIDSIAAGSSNVIINNKQAARLGDPTNHGGVIVAGCPTVIIGTSPQTNTLTGAAASGTPFCEECEKAKKALEAAKKKAQADASPPPDAATAAKPETPPLSPEDEKLLQSLYKKAAVAKPEIDALAHAVADKFPGAKVAEAPLKSRESVLRKTRDEYGGNLLRVKDFARNTIVVKAGDEEKALAALRQMYPAIKDDNVTLTRAERDPCGYSGINVKVPASNGMLTEVQINSPHMIYAKEKPDDAKRVLGKEQYDAIASKPGMPPGGKGHAHYEAYREMPNGPAKDAVGAQSKAYYAAVRTSAAGG